MPRPDKELVFSSLLLSSFLEGGSFCAHLAVFAAELRNYQFVFVRPTIAASTVQKIP